jgi:hypothetical protein
LFLLYQHGEYGAGENLLIIEGISERFGDSRWSCWFSLASFGSSQIDGCETYVLPTSWLHMFGKHLVSILVDGDQLPQGHAVLPGMKSEASGENHLETFLKLCPLASHLSP